MIPQIKKIFVMKLLLFTRFTIFIILISSFGHPGLTQDWHLVWSDEFDGENLNIDNWNFELGTTSDHVHYYTDRPENCQISDGKLLIIARRESYMGQEYTSSLIQTMNKVEWKYGKIEARIKVANTSGLVSAFWMMPIDGVYGFWPKSGEIDIMEHPTHEPQNIYGTIHTGAYNLFGGWGGPPKGCVESLPDLENEYHVYSVEWTPDSIIHLIDDQSYCSFENDHSGSDTWPFDQPFYIILNLSVGGSWTGPPDEGDTFPDTMYVDYVRVYQEINNLCISGTDFGEYNAQNVMYRIPIPSGASISWTVPADASIVSGQNSNKMVVNWNTIEGIVSADIEHESNSFTAEYPVVLSYNRLKNGRFDKGIKYWSAGIAGSMDATILLENDPGSGNNFIKADIQTVGTVPWDAQLSQRGFELENGQEYKVSFSAKADISGKTISFAVINSENFQVYAGETYTLSDEWTTYTYEFSMTGTASGMFNFDLAAEIGTYSIDDVSLLKIVDLQSDESFQNTTGNITIYPNPSDGHFTLTIDGIENEYLIQIFNNLGQTIYSLKKSCLSNELNLEEWGKGVYFIKISTSNEQMIKKILIQ
jgi:beta-glucanase (GH16 family)